MLKPIVIAAGMAALALAQQNPEADLRKALTARTGTVVLQSGTIEISREIVLQADAHDLEIKGAETVIKAGSGFRGRALLVMPAGRNIHIHDLSLDGNRDAVGRMIGLAPAGTLYSRFMPNNGILAAGVNGLEIDRIEAAHFAGFTILIGAAHNVRVHDVEITESGGFNPQRRNNATGGVLLEEGTDDFEIHRCQFGGLRGNAITLRSVSKGRIFENEFAVLARDAVQATEASGVAIADNRARQIGFPAQEVDGGALCFDLSGFDGGDVSGNTCEETLLGAIRIDGSHNKIAGNHLLRLNTTQKDIAGIYLDAAAKDNAVENNEIAGSGMSAHCVGGPAGFAAANRIAKNDCSDEASVALLRPARPR